MRQGIDKGRPKFINVEYELEKAGIEIANLRDGWADFICPLHNDTKPSASINLESGWWLCRAGCGKGWIESLTGELPEESPDATDELLLRLLEEPRPEIQKELNLQDYQHGITPRYMLDRGFTVETLKRWDIGWRAETEAIVIPVLQGGKILGHIDRPIYTGNGPKYDNQDGLKKSKVLFGLDMAVRYGNDEVVVVEGPLDTIWVDQCGFPAVGLLGADLSQEQEQLLTKNFLSPILAFDADPAGQHATRDVSKRLNRRGIRVRCVTLPPGRKDIQECTAEETAKAISEAREIFNASV